MTDDRSLLLALAVSLGLAVVACGGSSSTGPLNNASVVTDTMTLVDSMYHDTVWTVPIASGPFATFNARVATIDIPAITPAIAANGLVLVYISTDSTADSTNAWTPLPLSVAFDYLETFTYAYAAGQLQIAVYASPTNIDISPPDVYLETIPTEEFKIILASGSAAALLAERHVDLRSYSRVMAALRSLHVRG
jgi:hypothetical protein